MFGISITVWIGIVFAAIGVSSIIMGPGIKLIFALKAEIEEKRKILETVVLTIAAISLAVSIVTASRLIKRMDDLDGRMKNLERSTQT